jgi:hypothetical protein
MRTLAKAVVIGAVALTFGTAHMAQAGINVWTSNGPYGEGLIVAALAIDPTTPSTVYAGTWNAGGVYQSTNSGGSWSAVGLSGNVPALAIDPTTPSTVYAGSYGGGVFKSTNSGGSWNAVNTGLSGLDSFSVDALAINPITSSTLYAGTAGGVFDIEQVAPTACVVGTGTGASCTEAALDACLPGGGSFDGTVTFNCGGAATITVTSSKDISADTTIDGGSLITISGGNSVGVFSVNTGVKFTVQNLTIANGNSGTGGGISNGRINGDGSIIAGGTLTVTNSTFSDNTANLDGGGIYNGGGTLTVTNSTFSGNSATVGYGYGFGGGIANSYDGTLTVTNSIFSGNSAFLGGSIIAGGTWLTVTNSTFSDNTANLYGGAIYNSVAATVANSTFSGNYATEAGGAIANDGGTSLAVTNSTFSSNGAQHGGAINSQALYNDAASTLAVTNSTFSGNSNSGIYTAPYATATVTNTIVADGCAGSVTDGGHNIDDGTTCGFTGTGCTTTSGTSFCNTNPVLDPTGLQNNGGPTQTIALCTGPGAPSAGCAGASPAINAGNESVCSTTTGTAPVDNLDQRRFVRPGTGATNCSIGAYEANGAACVANCSDGSGCTSASQCTGGACDSSSDSCCGQTNDCSDGTSCTNSLQCTGGACDSSSDSCCGQTNDCSDGTSCTADSQCRSGTCAGGVCFEVPPNSSADTCEDTVAQNIKTLAVCTANCQTKEADYALKNQSFVEMACEQGTGRPISCLAAYDKAEAAVLAKERVKQAICPPCLGGTAQTALAESAMSAVHHLDGQIYCAGTTGFASGNPGFVPPDKNTGACEDTVSRNLRTLAGCITSCQKKEADAALKNKPFDVQACEEGSGKPTSCLAAYDKAQAAVLAKTATVNKQPICPTCLGQAAQDALADAMFSFIDQSSDGQIYCAGTVPLP